MAIVNEIQNGEQTLDLLNRFIYLHYQRLMSYKCKIIKYINRNTVTQYNPYTVYRDLTVPRQCVSSRVRGFTVKKFALCKPRTAQKGRQAGFRNSCFFARSQSRSCANYYFKNMFEIVFGWRRNIEMSWVFIVFGQSYSYFKQSLLLCNKCIIRLPKCPANTVNSKPKGFSPFF